MAKQGHEVEMAEIPDCDIHKATGDVHPATHDGATIMGPWAYMCDAAWAKYGPGRTGTGMGQKLILRGVKHDAK